MLLNTHFHLSYCSNIHPGESWPDTFSQLKQHIPAVKTALGWSQPFGIGLRLSAQAAAGLNQPDALTDFKNWLRDENAYVFTMNGFPYGSFHSSKVKDRVHQPDWTSTERVTYTLQLFAIMAQLLPQGAEGGISTSPLSYKPWTLPYSEQRSHTARQALEHLAEVLYWLVRYKQEQGLDLHIDIEPEPDGFLENASDVLVWYKESTPRLEEILRTQYQLNDTDIEDALTQRLAICYDVCHFAVTYEDHAKVLAQFREAGIRIGKFQLSAALKATMHPDQRTETLATLRAFEEPVYLHQVIARTETGELIPYPDLPQAFAASHNTHQEWRVHFHVPLFTEAYGKLLSTQSDVATVLALQKAYPQSRHLEVETYTWEVLPADLQMPIDDSIARELKWVIDRLVQ